MKNTSNFTKVLLFLLLTPTFSASYANTYINIPCPNYKRGDVIRFSSNIDNAVSSSQLIVKNVSNNTVELVSNSNIHGQKMNSLMVFSKKGNTMFLVKNTSNINGMKISNTFIPPEPVCGNVPSRYSFKTSSNNSFRNQGGSAMNSVVVLSKIGDKNLNSPLGNLKTVVIKKTTTLTMANSPIRTTNTSISYNANKYGKVKEIITMATKMPDFSSMYSNNKAYDKVFENITNDNIQDKLKQMQKIGTSQPQGKIKYRIEKHITKIDLISYKSAGTHK